VARFAPLVPLVAGALMLVAGEFLVVREIRAVTVVPPGGTETGGGLHGYALAVIGVALLPMAYGAVVARPTSSAGTSGAARPAALALVALALAACAIVLFVDRPSLDDTGSIGTLYELAEAHPGPGFYVSAAGAGLALVGAMGAVALSVRPRQRDR
jgi:hypothetical protein